MKYEAVIGLEIHSELKTNTKIFCGCATTFGAEQNTHVCPICLGLPGVLPVVNRRVVEFAIKAGIALNCTINKFSKFDRKNYYYPDLPKNFQTSQYDLPIAEHGYVDIETEQGKKRIRITRIHMEEDAGKLVHSGTTIKDSSASNVDYNRTGVPLIEIVSEPDMSTLTRLDAGIKVGKLAHQLFPNVVDATVADANGNPDGYADSDTDSYAYRHADG